MQLVTRDNSRLQGITGVYKGLQEDTWGYGGSGLQEVTGSYRGLQGVAGGYKRLEGVMRGYQGLQGVTGGYRGT